jgi:DNA-binding MarR family transcriptional regulator
MARNQTDIRPDQDRILLGLLESVERESQQTQRDLAQEFGVALGLVNAYLRYCIKKGLVRVKKVPSHRYLYFLTPHGFAEKSRLSLQLVSSSLVSFRNARRDYEAAFVALKGAGHSKVVLVGHSELSEIAILCALNHGLMPIAVVDPNASAGTFAGIPVVNSFCEVAEMDSAVLTDLRTPQASYDQSVAQLGVRQVIAPAILGIRSTPA